MLSSDYTLSCKVILPMEEEKPCNVFHTLVLLSTGQGKERKTFMTQSQQPQEKAHPLINYVNCDNPQYLRLETENGGVCFAQMATWGLAIMEAT